MTSARLGVWEKWGWPLLTALRIGGLLLLGLIVARWFAAPSLLPADISWSTIAIATGAYMVGHIVRVARLALIIGDQRLSLRQLVAVHLFTSSVLLGVPFKLGEIYRIAELSTVTFSRFGALVVVWVERCFDIGIVLLLLLAVLLFSSLSAVDYWPLIATSLVFVGGTLVVVTLVPDNLRRLANHIIRRYDADWTIDALQFIAQTRRLFRHGSLMLQGRIASLAVCSIVIWGFEALSLTIILTSRGQGKSTIDAMLSFLSNLVRGDTVLTHLASVTGSQGSSLLSAYLLATQIPLVLIGGVCGLYLLWQRIALAAGPQPKISAVP